MAVRHHHALRHAAGLVLGAACLAAPLAAQEAAPLPAPAAPQAAPAGTAPITLVGRKGEPIAIVDNRTGEVSTDEAGERFVNQMSPEALIRQEVRQVQEAEAAEADAEARREQAEQTAAAAADAAKAKAEAQAKADKAAGEAARQAKAENDMRGMGWQPWTPDGKILFNPNTFQFQPREEIVERFLPPEE